MYHCDVTVIGGSNRHCEERSNPAPCVFWIASFLAMTASADGKCTANGRQARTANGRQAQAKDANAKSIRRSRHTSRLRNTFGDVFRPLAATPGAAGTEKNKIFSPEYLPVCNISSIFVRIYLYILNLLQQQLWY
jgi:hypothetical protein